MRKEYPIPGKLRTVAPGLRGFGTLSKPQTLGKVERFWGTLWRECLETAVFLDLGDAQRLIGLSIDHY
jgi:hypothetical protein